MGEEGAEALPGDAGEADGDAVLGQALMAVAPRHLARQHRADGAVDVDHAPLDHHRFAIFERRRRGRDQVIVERAGEAVVLDLRLVEGVAHRGDRLVEQAAEIDAVRFPVIERLAHVDTIDPPDHLLNGAEAHLRHDLAQFFGDEEEIVDHMLGLAGEARA